MIRNLVVLILGLLLIFSPKLLPATNPSWIVPAGKIGLVVIDVGSEGDAQLLVSPGGETMLVDTGDNNEPTAWPNLQRVLLDNKISSLNILVITHPHQDHLGNVINVLKTFKPQLVVLSGVVHTNQTYEEMLRFIRDNNIPAVQGRAEQTLDFDKDVSVEILGPNDLAAPNLNNTSIILKVSFGKFSALITGDAEVEQERQQLSTLAGKLPATVLKAGHHGSRTSSSEEYLQAVDPELVVVSAGHGNQYGHPHEEVLNRLNRLGINTLITKSSGTITIISDGETYEVKTER